MKSKRIWAFMLSAVMILLLVPCSIAFADEAHGENDIYSIAAADEASSPYTAEKVRAMIDALPDVSELENMDSDELSEVHDKAQDAYDAFEALTEEQQAELSDELAKLRDVLEYMTTQVAPLATEAETLNNTSTRTSDITYSDGVSQYFTYNSRLYKITYTNIKWTTVCFRIYQSSGNYYLRLYNSRQYMNLYDNTSSRLLTTSDIPTTQGAELIGYDINRQKVVAITCLELKENPTWNWTGTSSAKAVFTAKNYDVVCATVNASVTSTVTSDNAGNHTIDSTATASFWGKTYTDTKKDTSACSYENGICSVCGGYQQAEKNSKDCYEISNLGQLCWFSQQVGDGKINVHSAILTADITIDNSVVWKPIDLTDNCSSTFDGNYHTITFANTKEDSSFGLFGSYNYSTIQNLYLAGSITCTSKYDVGVLVNRAYRTQIINVISTCTINNAGVGPTGGLAGYFGGGRSDSSKSAIENCAVYADVTGGNYAGGLIGQIWNGNQYVDHVTGCAYMGSVNGAVAGALVGYNGNNSSKKSPFTDVYYCEKNGLGYLGATYGGTITATRVESMTAEQFKSGEVAYKLNNGKTDGTQVWYQTCKTDSYPKFNGDTVYRGYVCGGGSSDPIYANSMDGLIINASPEHIYDDGICVNCKTTKPADFDKAENVYKIYSLGQLQWFADYVNAGNTGINGKLMNDIDASSLASLAIGVNDGKDYSGTFDGSGYTVNINLNGSANTALFPYVNGAVIKNLTVTGSVTASGKFAGSLAGQTTGDVTIEKCISTVVITSTVNGDGTHGGLVGVANGGTLNINNCGFAGAINGSGTYSCGGLVGWSNITTNISNSFVAASFGVNSDGGNTFARNKVTTTNCYYLSKLGDAPTSSVKKSADEFASGEVAYLLQGTQQEQIWGQKIGTDTLPTFSTAKVYEDTYNGEKIYRNEIDGNRIFSLGADKKSATVLLNAAGTYTIVFADYEDNRLANIKTFAVTVDKAQAVRVVSDKDFTLGTGDKVMLWADLTNLKPLCEAYEVK